MVPTSGQDQLGLTPASWTSPRIIEFSIRLDILYSYIVTGEDDNAVFSIAVNTGRVKGRGERDKETR